MPIAGNNGREWDPSMHTAITTLEMAARTFHLSGNLDKAQYRHILAQLREVMDELSAVERRTGNPITEGEPVDLSQLLRAAVAGSVDQNGDGALKQIAEGVFVEGPRHDLHDLIGSLVEFARGVGPDPIDLWAQVKYADHQLRAACMVELVVQSPDIPDFLRRRLWDTVRVRRGEVSVTYEPKGCRIGFTLPIERRLGTVLG
jgi:hypothetical protein